MHRLLVNSIVLAAAPLVLGSCVHTTEVTNLKDYEILLTTGARRDIAIVRTKLEGDAADFHRHVANAFGDHPAVAEVRTNWDVGVSEPGFVPDLVVDVVPEATYHGNGANFFITFPGFLVFANAWHGFVYDADVATDVRFLDPQTGEVIDTVRVETPFEVRHCDFGRGFWATSGWWTPGYGATSLLAGLYMMTYDGDVTPELIRKVGRTYGLFVADRTVASPVARRIVEQNRKLVLP